MQRCSHNILAVVHLSVTGHLFIFHSLPVVLCPVYKCCTLLQYKIDPSPIRGRFSHEADCPYSCTGMEGLVSSVGLLQGSWWWPLVRTSSAWIVYPWTGRHAPAAGNPTRCSQSQTLPGWKPTHTLSGTFPWM